MSNHADPKTIIRLSVVLLLSFLFASSFAATPVGKTWSKAESTIDCGNGRRGTKCFQLETINLEWDHPTQRVDNSPLALTEVAHYVIQIERAGVALIIQKAVGKGTATTEPAISGDYTFRIATMTSDKQLGPFSEDVFLTVD